MLNQLMLAMCEFDRGVPHRIQHFTKVHAYCRLIGQEEGLSPRQMEILEAAAYTHDIGIKPALEKFGSAAGMLAHRPSPHLSAGGGNRSQDSHRGGFSGESV